MEQLATHLLIALTTFAITNIDDLLILSLYFANPDFRKGQVVIGQYLGVWALVAISLIGLLFGAVLEPKLIGLLGLVPIFIGMNGMMTLFKKEDQWERKTAQKSEVQFLNVALITMANGGDNIGVYTPLFASAGLHLVLVYLLVFTLMIGVWCALAFYLVRHPLVKNAFAQYGQKLLPFFLISLGIWILMEADSLSFLF